MNVLQPNNGIVSSANLNLFKFNQTITAKADSTNNDNCENSCPLPGSSSDQRTGMPFKKHHHSVKKFQTPSVSRRNARERNRVKQVNDGFSVLKNHIPNMKNKTSKVDTLRAAVDYIKSLRSLLGHPIKEENLHMGPVLISDLDESSSLDSLDTTSKKKSTSTDLASLVYSLPSMAWMEDLDVRSSKLDSTFYGDGKENLTDSFTFTSGMDLCGSQAPNWNWTSPTVDGNH